jgi:hypothetical protein
MAQYQDFSLEPSPQLEPNGDPVQKKVDPSDHQDRSLAAIRLPAMPDWVFGRDRYSAWEAVI